MGQAQKALAKIAADERAEARRREEATAWTMAQKSGAKKDLERFVKAYPDGKHVEQAQKALAKIAADERAEARRREEATAWMTAQKGGTREELQRFIEAYPDGAHAGDAQRAIAAIERAEAQLAADLAAWAEADRSGAKTALRQYLTGFPEGVFSAEARQRLTQLEAEEREKDDAAWLRATRRNNKASYAGYLASYPNGRRATDARVRLAELERIEPRPPAEAVKVVPGPPPVAPSAPKWQSADEPFIGADGRIRR
jgi:TolA-binding protein